MRDRSEEKRNYHGDVVYEVWRRGGNVDRINDDRVSDSFYSDLSVERAARREMPKPSQPLEDEYSQEVEDEGATP